MGPLTEKEILEKYEQLPEDLKEAIFGAEVTGIVNSIGKKFNLHIDKIGELANETGMVMLGVTRPKEFVPNLSDRLEVDTETARKIAQDINSQIFMKVRESLKKIHNGEEMEPPSPRPADSPHPRGEGAGVRKEDILEVIERPELPAVLQGANKPEEAQNLFEVKTKEEVQRAPMEETKHFDPYREPIE
jgi:hypothetical protein